MAETPDPEADAELKALAGIGRRPLGGFFRGLGLAVAVHAALVFAMWFAHDEVLLLALAALGGVALIALPVWGWRSRRWGAFGALGGSLLGLASELALLVLKGMEGTMRG